MNQVGCTPTSNPKSCGLQHEAESALIYLLSACVTRLSNWCAAVVVVVSSVQGLNPSAFGHIDLSFILVTYMCSSSLVLTIGLDLRLCFHSYSCAFLKCPFAHDSRCSWENPCVKAIVFVEIMPCGMTLS